MTDSLLQITILTCIVYLIANSFTYKISSQFKCQPPLYDVIHELLPNLSQHVHIRDYILLIMILPIIFIKDLWQYIPDLWYCFMIIVFIKAISIFFTSIPSSHPSCNDPSIIDLNHCHHSSVSGHSSLAVILAVLYIKGGFNKWIVGFICALYCILVIISRSHYTTDVIQGVLFTLLITSSL